MEYELLSPIQVMAVLKERLLRLEAQHAETEAALEAQKLALRIIEESIVVTRDAMAALNGSQ